MVIFGASFSSMESLLGFKDTPTYLHDNNKLVPWLCWDEWDCLRISLLSSSPHSVAKALRRIAAWRSRGCLPVAIEVTASIVEIQQRDPHFRVDLNDGDSDSEEMLGLLYTMAIMRLVNGVIEKTRKKTDVSIAVAAAAIDIPRMLIDIRHDGSHRELPSLRLLRIASVKALDWLKSYYWDAQKNAIPYQRAKSADVRKEIRSKLRELDFSLKVKQFSGSSSSETKRKHAKHHESLGVALHGRNKFFSLIMAGKTQPSKYVGSKKQLKRTLKSLVRLYSFFSCDVVYVLLELLLKASNSMDIVDSPDNFQINVTLDVAQIVFDEWKPMITKLSKTEPEVLLNLLKAVIDMIESRKAIRDDFGSERFSLFLYDSETQRIEVLSSLFMWLLLVLKGLKSSHNEGQGRQTESVCVVPEQSLIEILRKCLLISVPENHELLAAAVLLGEMVGSSYLNEKLNKFSRLTLPSSRLTEGDPSNVKAEDLIHHDKLICRAAEKLQLLQHHKIKNLSSPRAKDDSVEDTEIWIVSKSCNPCPIGMLPRAVGSSGCLPVLDCDVDCKLNPAVNSIVPEEQTEVGHCGSREANCDIEMMEVCNDKRREAENIDFSDPCDLNAVPTSTDGLKGQLLIGGVWQMVGEQELREIKSRVSILVDKK